MIDGTTETTPTTPKEAALGTTYTELELRTGNENYQKCLSWLSEGDPDPWRNYSLQLGPLFQHEGDLRKMLGIITLRPPDIDELTYNSTNLSTIAEGVMYQENWYPARPEPDADGNPGFHYMRLSTRFLSRPDAHPDKKNK